MQQRGDLGGTRVILDREVEKNSLLPSLHQLHLQVTTESPLIVRMIVSKAISNTGSRRDGKKESSYKLFNLLIQSKRRTKTGTMWTSHCFIAYKSLKSRQDYFQALRLASRSNLMVWRIYFSTVRVYLESFTAPSTLFSHKQQPYRYLFPVSENPAQYDTVWSADGSFVCTEYPSSAWLVSFSYCRFLSLLRLKFGQRPGRQALKM